MSMKNSNDTIGDLTRDLPTCSAVPQPAAPHKNISTKSKFVTYFCLELSHQISSKAIDISHRDAKAERDSLE